MVIWSTIRYHHRSWLTRLRWMSMPLTTSNCSAVDIGSSINDCNGAAISASEYYMCRRRVDVTSINHQLQLSQNLSNHHSKMMSTAINRKYMLLCAQPRYSEQAHRRWEQYLYILLDKVLQYIEQTRQRYPHTIVLKVQGLILLFRRNTLYNPRLAHYGCSKVVHRSMLRAVMRPIYGLQYVVMDSRRQHSYKHLQQSQWSEHQYRYRTINFNVRLKLKEKEMM